MAKSQKEKERNTDYDQYKKRIKIKMGEEDMRIKKGLYVMNKKWDEFHRNESRCIHRSMHYLAPISSSAQPGSEFSF